MEHVRLIQIRISHPAVWYPDQPGKRCPRPRTALFLRFRPI